MAEQLVVKLTIDLPEIVRRYGLDGGLQLVSVAPAVRHDLAKLVEYLQGLNRAHRDLLQNYDGAKSTVVALVKRAGGTLDVPHREIYALHDNDGVMAEDITGDDGVAVKRFTFVSAREH